MIRESQKMDTFKKCTGINACLLIVFCYVPAI